ncbi:unnamed protein product [Coregonus sp. 'balchen']|nr:unnamed protein product [Coregonus sp. 'balchen']
MSSLTSLLGGQRQMTDSLIETVKTKQQKAANQFAEWTWLPMPLKARSILRVGPRLQYTMKFHSNLHQALEGLQLQPPSSPSPSLDPMSSGELGHCPPGDGDQPGDGCLKMQPQFDVARNRSAEFLKENNKLSGLLRMVESSVADLQSLLTYHQVLVEDTMKDNSIQHKM